MKVLKVYPVDITVVCELRISEVKKIMKALENSEITVTEKDEGSFEARDYVVEEFYPWLKQITEDFKDVS